MSKPAKEPKGVLCCGSYRTTPYCPYCGNKLRDDPVLSLGEYLNDRYNGARSKVAALNRNRKAQIKQVSSSGNIPTTDPSILSLDKQIAAAQRDVVRWKQLVKAFNMLAAPKKS